MPILNKIKEWGMDMTNNTRGGLIGTTPSLSSPKQIYLLQRKKGVLGKGLGKTTGWIVRAEVRRGVRDFFFMICILKKKKKKK